VPVFLAYALSFANVGIFWNNHHHMLHVTERINGMVLWANLFLLFWMSLVPFVIRWMDDVHFDSSPTAAYGVVLVLCSISYILLERSITRCNGPKSKRARVVGGDSKSAVSLLMYALIDVRVGDSTGLRTSLGCARAVRGGCHDLVYTRSAH
jgi:TMEM175 potassium channel family protein